MPRKAPPSRPPAPTDRPTHPTPPPSARFEGKRAAPEAHVVHAPKGTEARRPPPPEPKTAPTAVRSPQAGEPPKKTDPPEPKPPDIDAGHGNGVAP